MRSKIFCSSFLIPITLAPSCVVASPQSWETTSPIQSYDPIEAILSKQRNKEESFYVYDLSKLEESHAIWEKEMYNITPFYAVKCNPNIMVLKKLASLHTHFDCASPHEIDLVLSTGVHPSRIIYANPCKRMCDIQYAHEKGVTMTTFDSVGELRKIHAVCPDMKVVLRIYANDPNARCKLSNKFGAEESQWKDILDVAKELGMELHGISFHVGSGASSSSAFEHAIMQARVLYDIATSPAYGFNIVLLDLGGGFSRSTLPSIAPAIQDAIDKYFSFPCECKVIAEPGRFYVETCATLYTKVIGAKMSTSGEYMYTLTDGVYGSFNNIVYDHAKLPQPVVLRTIHETTVHPSILFGPTCDGFDTIMTCALPKMRIGDILAFDNMGAYTVAGACNFNGIQCASPTCYYIR